jgi:hypothetical protein
MNRYSLSSLLTLQLCVDLSLLHALWRFRNSRYFRIGVCLHHAQPPNWRTRYYTFLSDRYPLDCQAWVALPGIYAPVSIVLSVTEARKTPLHDNMNK